MQGAVTLGPASAVLVTHPACDASPPKGYLSTVPASAASRQPVPSGSGSSTASWAVSAASGSLGTAAGHSLSYKNSPVHNDTNQRHCGGQAAGGTAGAGTRALAGRSASGLPASQPAPQRAARAAAWQGKAAGARPCSRGRCRAQTRTQLWSSRFSAAKPSSSPKIAHMDTRITMSDPKNRKMRIGHMAARRSQCESSCSLVLLQGAEG